MASSFETRDHDEIRRWVESRGGIPTVVKGTGGLLRIDFVKGPKSHGREPSLEEVDWDGWFRVFDDRGLVFLAGMKPGSKFFKLVSPETVQEKQSSSVELHGDVRTGSGSRRSRSSGRSRGKRREEGTTRRSRSSSRASTGARRRRAGSRKAKTGTSRRRSAARTSSRVSSRRGSSRSRSGSARTRSR